MKTYIYFVSYHMLNSYGYGFGCCEYHLPKPISSFDDINKISSNIKQAYQSKHEHIENVIILNYQLLRVEKE